MDEGSGHEARGRHRREAHNTKETYTGIPVYKQRQGKSNDFRECQIRQAHGVDILRRDAVEGRRHRAPALRGVEQGHAAADDPGPPRRRRTNVPLAVH